MESEIQADRARRWRDYKNPVIGAAVLTTLAILVDWIPPSGYVMIDGPNYSLRDLLAKSPWFAVFFAIVFLIIFVIQVLFPHACFHPQTRKKLCPSCDQFYPKNKSTCDRCGADLADPKRYKWIEDGEKPTTT